MPTDVQTDELLLTVVEVAKKLRSSRTIVYPLITSGKLPSIKIGRRRLVRVSDLADYVAGIPADPSPSSAYRKPGSHDEDEADAA